MSKHITKRQKWSLDNTRSNKVATESLAAPPAYQSPTSPTPNIETKKTDLNRLLNKKSWDVALAPLKQVPMNIFIMYMAGNSISIFPIMMVGMLLMRPIQSLLSTKSTFKMMEGSNVLHVMVFILGHLVNIGLALYKCATMGLLPTHSSDWLAFVEPPIRQEFLGGGIKLH